MACVTASDFIFRINGKPFLNVSGSGFDVEVLRKTEELKAVYPGPKAYTKAVLAVLGSYQAMEAEVSIDGGAFAHTRATIIEIANYHKSSVCI